MAKYVIQNLNSISNGKNRTFINMDVRLLDDVKQFVNLLKVENGENILSDVIRLEEGKGEYAPTEYIQNTKTDENGELSVFPLAKESSREGIILNEIQKYYDEYDPYTRDCIRLINQNDNEDLRKKITEYIKNNSKIEHIFFTDNQDNIDSNVINSDMRPLYDIDDVDIKLNNRIKNDIITSFDKKNPGKTEDIYIPDGLTKHGICQIGDKAYFVTSQTDKECSMLKCGEQKNQYNIKFLDQNLHTNLYKQLSELSSPNYPQALSSGEMTNMEFFNSVHNLNGIDYNYIVKCNLDEVNGKQTEYMNGNIYSDVLIGKNFYDSVYNMSMDENNISGCRQYVEVNKYSQCPYFKYYDSDNYTINGDLSNGQINVSKKENDKLPYQKIEIPIEFKTRSSNRHKSYFFSINIDDISIEKDEKEDGSKSLQYKIKSDISRAIRDIAQNICPVETQLYDVKFGEYVG